MIPIENATPAEVSIRRIAVGDVASFHRCLDTVAREGRYLAMLEAPPLDQVSDFVAEGRKHGIVQFVAVAADRVVGWCDVSPIRWVGFRHSGNLGMGLLSEFRRRGIGRRLLDATLTESRRQGITRVQLEVFVSNRAAVAFYEKYGFNHEGLKRNARELDGGSEDMACMVRFLSPGGTPSGR